MIQSNVIHSNGIADTGSDICMTTALCLFIAGAVRCLELWMRDKNACIPLTHTRCLPADIIKERSKL